MNIVVELVSGYCNSNCIWCYRQYNHFKQLEYGMMNLEDFKTFCNLNKNLSIIPFSHGESLIHPHFNQMINYALNSNYKLHSIHSNLSMKIFDSTIELLKSFENVIVNVGGLRQDIHYTNMKTDLEVVKYNLKRLESIRNKITIKMVVNKNNYHDTDFTFMGYLVNKYPLLCGASHSTDRDVQRFYDDNIAGMPENKLRDTYLEKDNRLQVIPIINICPDKSFTVKYNGRTMICCRSVKIEKSCGDAFKIPLENIFNSEMYKEYIKNADKRNYCEYCEYCS
jgi:MoaA/NifB/PqqE/SkfB family radical SAM enzyme